MLEHNLNMLFLRLTKQSSDKSVDTFETESYPPTNSHGTVFFRSGPSPFKKHIQTGTDSRPVEGLRLSIGGRVLYLFPPEQKVVLQKAIPQMGAIEVPFARNLF